MGRKRSADAISKTEAVRRALAAGQATAAEGVPWVKGQFGLDLTPNHFNTIKSTLEHPGQGPGRGQEGQGGVEVRLGRVAIDVCVAILHRTPLGEGSRKKR